MSLPAKHFSIAYAAMNDGARMAVALGLFSIAYAAMNVGVC